MVKWNITVITDTNNYRYETDSDKRKSEFIAREKNRPEVISISVNKVRCYRRKS